MTPEILNTPPPPPMLKTPRLQDWHKQLKEGESIKTDVATAACIANYFRNHGGATTRRIVDLEGDEKIIQIWVIKNCET